MMNPPGTRSTIHDLANAGRYSEIPEALKERPQDAKWRNRNGETSLLVLCKELVKNDDLLKAVDALLSTDPFLAGIDSRNGHSPLYYLCSIPTISKYNEKLILELIQTRPEIVGSIVPSSYSCKTSFHIVCERNASKTILFAMLQADPDIATRPRSHIWKSTYSFPLGLLWNSIEKKGFIDTDDLSKMALLLRAATHASLDIDTFDGEDAKGTDDFEVLRAACQFNPCPRPYITFLIGRYSKRASWADRRGWLPLHYALYSANCQRQSYTKFVIKSLLQQYPAAAAVPFPDWPGMLPLHFLITDREMVWQGGIKDLVYAYPDALIIPNPRNGLVPALSSAIRAIQGRHHFSTTYELLRRSPELFESAIKNK